MRRYLMMSAATFGLSVAVASAADMGAPAPVPIYTKTPVEETSSWTGFYAGIHAGYGWGAWNGNQIYTDQALVPAVLYGPFDASSHTINGNGALAGGQLGFNYQFGHFVAGVEGDGSWANIKGDTLLFPYPSDPTKYDPKTGIAIGTPGWGFGIENKWLTTARGRLGVTTGPLLLYGTGGAAFGGFHETHTVLGYGYADNALSTRDETKTGWTAGAGVEWAISNNWSAKAEYLYMSFPDVGGVMQWAAKYGPATDGFKGDWNVHTVDLGLNYKF